MLSVLQTINALSQSLPAFSASYYVRSLRDDEPIPQFGPHNVADHPLSQRKWIWVAYDKLTDRPVALLAACPMHGPTVMLCRVYSCVTAGVLVPLFRKTLADCYSRGYTQYAVFLDGNEESNRKLFRLVMRAGGIKLGDNYILAAGPTLVNR